MRRGFTLIELLVVMAIIATLLSIATPRYFAHLDRAREAALRETLSVVRDSIDKFHADTGRYPAELDELVTKRYLRRLPVDPVSESAETWVIVPPPNEVTGVWDVKSGAGGEERPYAQW
ncbi:MAG: prepilin-type N-terminal cleavage/methylation domain-containing protein [Rhodoferax sp.]|uniref:type II secretion system protein n=1 Tax=Rhodoferax sp. TaxID=50421 RepID=UPI002719D622|nr:prepilin-type N-terminal cleavage/methylation domain-containing protein [Rhodoferax sp.]MDO8450811.1 prepilin-type N-terminal cleavage/methylation domain-containing protein [Rhodoferax sp.]